MLVRRHLAAVAGVLVLLGFSGAGTVWAEDLVSHWKELLAGAKLERQSHVSSGSGAGAGLSTTWDLCRDGTFHSSHSSTASVEAPGSLSLSTNAVTHTGRWSVEIRGEEALLVLMYRDGRRIAHALSADGPTTSLDGERVTSMRSSICP